MQTKRASFFNVSLQIPMSFNVDKCCFWVNKSKDLIKVFLCIKATAEEKIKMLVTGKSKYSECFKGIKSLKMKFELNKLSGLSLKILTKWLKAFSKQIGRQYCENDLLIDNCSSHSKNYGEKLKNVKVIFYPPYCKSKLLPVDLRRIIKLKIHYRK